MPKKLVLLAAILSFTLGALPSLASASSLTSQQVSAIVSLLQSFGANASTIASVQSALTGQPSTTAPASCVSLMSDLYAGETDAQTNGQVSQLQSFLNVNPTGYFGPLTEQAVQNYQSSHGIVSSGSPDTTGYGFVGPVTRGSMGCATTTTRMPSVSFTATPMSGAAPLNTTFSFGQNPWYLNGYSVDFGDGSSPQLLGVDLNSCRPAGPSPCNGIGYQYGTAGTYTATLKDSSGNVLGTQTITVTDNQTNQPTATIDPSSLTTSSLTPTITGTATGLAQVSVYIGQNTAAHPTILDGSAVPVVNGRWSYSVPASDGLVYSGSYYVSVQNGNTGLAKGAITFANSSVLSNTPTATIDQSSLTTRWSNIPTLSGSASGLSSVYVTMSGNNQEGHSQGNVPVVSGRWSTVIYPLAISAFPSGTYQVSVYAPASYPVDPTSAAPLTTGTVTMVDVPSAGPISTSSSSPWAPVFTGTAMNTSTVNLLILNASSTPQYATVLSSGTIAVTNGNWAWRVLPGAISSGSYVVQVLAGGTNTYIAADPFTVSTNGTVTLSSWTGQKG